MFKIEGLFGEDRLLVGVYRRFELENTPLIVKIRRKKKESGVVEERIALYTPEIEKSSYRIHDLQEKRGIQEVVFPIYPARLKMIYCD